jgi:hypothetical protein
MQIDEAAKRTSLTVDAIRCGERLVIVRSPKCSDLWSRGLYALAAACRKR